MTSGDQIKHDTRLIAEYVISNIDAALEKGWINVYYQPVIRSLTGQLCGAESLARWIDPTIGFLSPDKFIGALEASRQIHKLDCWIVDKVCSDISKRIKDGLTAVPVSVNFSRLDFEATDMLKVVETAVKKHDIPKDYIHVEITESMIVSDADLMRRIIENFRTAGYEVWMDDFGSGYSSLNLLKDYSFDTLKMDMNFLSSFTEKSKTIMTAAINMAKDINITTLAEGVETAEQVEFLKSIGCGKLQGYFYGKPMPIDEFFEHISEFGITIEERQWRHYYQEASFAARHTDEPLEIIEDDGENFRTLFMNDEYKRQIQLKSTLTLEQLDKLIYQTKSPLIKKYREFANTIETTKNLETLYYTYNGNILSLQAKEIAEHGGKHIIKASNRNISLDINLRKQNNVNNKLKELNHIFESVLIANPEKNTITPLLGSFAYSGRSAKGTNNLSEHLKIMSEDYVASTDKEKFLDFTSFENVSKRIEASEKGYIENIFRLRQKDGNYRWREVAIMLVPGTHGKEYMISTKATTDDAQKFLTENNGIFDIANYGSNNMDPSLFTKMWENILANASVKFFWKDKNRRFLGASQAFLDYYGLTIDELVGKTDEEMKWHIDDQTFHDNELDVIEKGVYIKNAPGQCIVNGVVHNIMVNKSPIYENGQIVGLMGYFVDIDQELKRLDKLYQTRKVDAITGLMNISALSEVSVDFAQNYKKNGVDYAFILVRDEAHHRIVDDFGEEFGNRLLKVIGDTILKVSGGKCAVAKCLESDFALLTNTTEKPKLDMLINRLFEELSGIKELDGIKITLKIRIAFCRRSDKDITDENIFSSVTQKF